MMKITLLLLIMVTGAILASNPEDEVVFLDVGQGDSILLQNGTQQVLVDGGPGMQVLTRLGEEIPWWDKTIEVVILTHPQQDHVEGLLHVLDRYNVKLVLLPYASHTSKMQEAWIKKIVDKDIDYRFAFAGQSLKVGEMDISILAPFDSEEAKRVINSNLNNASVVTRIDFGEMSFLLTGDAESKTENILLKNLDSKVLDVDVLKVGHHGSKSSTTEKFFEAVSPSTVVISVGEDNKFGHPDEKVLNLLENIPIWRTDSQGTISFERVRGEWLLSDDKT